MNLSQNTFTLLLSLSAYSGGRNLIAPSKYDFLLSQRFILSSERWNLFVQTAAWFVISVTAVTQLLSLCVHCRAHWGCWGYCGGTEGGRDEHVLSILLHPGPVHPPALLIHIAALQSGHHSVRQIGNKRPRRLRACPGHTAREWKAHSLSPAQAAESWNSNKRLFHSFHKFENPWSSLLK